ncbi:hypothetical protein [Streptomyces sp. NBC_00343]|uniref:hypothetical protein n=1 Tax=Streptomyces sp. NBC_00343 TaxID=2975719 RepID=UPI002E2DA095|nr:hypothetical protein [Streptomyces sp. NBC_00343]
MPTDALPGATRLDGLSPTRIVLSSHDDLRPSGELLERQLAEAKVPVPPTWPTECSTDI